MENKEKPPCEYGERCYRKNPKHFEQFSHPTKKREVSNPEKLVGAAKRMKLEKNFERKISPTIQKTRQMKQTVLTFRADDKSSKKKIKDSESSKGAKLLNNEELQAKSSNKTPLPEISSKSNHKKSTQNSSSPCIYSQIKGTSAHEYLKNESVKEIIKKLFLVDMPECFYSFYDFLKSANEDGLEKSLETFELKLAGPFSVLLGNMNSQISSELAVCHWRYFYDPPEFQTVLASTKSGFHIGYWRDDPNSLPVFLASNNSDKDSIFKVEAESIFGAIYHYLGNFAKTSDPFARVKISKFQALLSQWAANHNFSLEKSTDQINQRQKKVVAKTFHKLGIVVPVDKKTDLGYRPLIESDANIKKICKLIINADKDEVDSLWENLQPLINAANIANDECDFGNSLELGIDLFCMGSPVFHDVVEHLLCTAYSLLNRDPFAEIIRCHLKRRKTGNDLSVI